MSRPADGTYFATQPFVVRGGEQALIGQPAIMPPGGLEKGRLLEYEESVWRAWLVQIFIPSRAPRTPRCWLLSSARKMLGVI